MKNSKCLIKECEKKQKAKGMCPVHYMKEYNKINYYGRNVDKLLKVKDLRYN